MKYDWYVIATTVSVLSACSPPADPIGRGGAHFEVDRPLDPSLQDFACGTPGIGGIGSPDPESPGGRSGPPDLPTAGSALQPTNMGSKVSDGEKSGSFGTYKVECRVSGKNTYLIDLDMAGPNASEFAPSTSGETSIQLNASVDATTGIGTGRVYVRTTETGAVNPNVPCSLKVLTDPDDASIYRVKPGSIDLTFVCKDNTPSTAKLTRCETRGTVTLDNCIED